MINSHQVLKELTVPFTSKNLSQIILFSLAFCLLGILGLQLQSTQTGVTPVWPASGLTFACLLLFGFRLWPGVIIGMVLLSYYTGLPIWLALVAGLGTVLETIIPLTIAKRYGFTGRLDSLFEALTFTTILSLGPIISSLIGTAAMYISSGGTSLPSMSVVMVWWLGNSIGILLLGGLILTVNTGIEKGLALKLFWEKFSLILAAILICSLAFLSSKGIEATLYINLIIPLTLIGAIRFSAFGALVPGAVATLLLLSISSHLPVSYFEHAPFGYLYLILVKIWFVSISGVLMAGAFHDRSSQIQMKWLAHHDTLTQLANRCVLEQETAHALLGMRRMDQGLCLLFIDLDQLKAVNDQLGHSAGDALLVATGQLLQKQVRSSDIVARWGGDEFIILLHDCKINEANQIAEKILLGAHDLSITSKRRQIHVSMSIGATCASEADTPVSLIERADKACYDAKNSGRDRVVTVKSE